MRKKISFTDIQRTVTNFLYIITLNVFDLYGLLFYIKKSRLISQMRALVGPGVIYPCSTDQT